MFQAIFFLWSITILGDMLFKAKLAIWPGLKGQGPSKYKQELMTQAKFQTLCFNSEIPLIDWSRKGFTELNHPHQNHCQTLIYLNVDALSISDCLNNWIFNHVLQWAQFMVYVVNNPKLILRL